MSRRIRKRKCKNCKEFFPPDARNANRQKFCSKPECRKASKADSQRRWLQKPENQNYFRDPDNVKRVQEWRQGHPGYWQRKVSSTENALQDPLSENVKEKQTLDDHLIQDALQDLLIVQPAVFIGLISQLTGCALQDDIASTLRRTQQLGNDILHQPMQRKGGGYDQETSGLSAEAPQSAQTVQLGGSPAGP